MSVRREPWGTTREGEPVELFTLEHGPLRARFTNFGATLVSLEVPDRHGHLGDVVLGFDSLAEYESPRNPYFGGVVGRCANRIAGARFVLDEREYVLAANEGRNHLHGGVRGFDRRTWTLQGILEQGVSFRLWSPDGEEGYPGGAEVTATYALDSGALALRLEARALAPTIVNLTQHSYFNLAGFNLAGAGTVLDHELEVRASRYVVVDDELLPTGELDGVEDSAFDFRVPRRIGECIPEPASPAAGHDLCYALEAPCLSRAAYLSDPRSGRKLRISTDAPGLQLYTGNHLNGVAGKSGLRYPRFGGVCLEAQHFPDAVHQPSFPSVVLRPGEVRQTTTIWTFSAH